MFPPKTKEAKQHQQDRNDNQCRSAGRNIKDIDQKQEREQPITERVRCSPIFPTIARQLKERMGEDMVGVFILPPDGKSLERRLRSRGQDADEVVARRLEEAVAAVGDRERVIASTDCACRGAQSLSSCR